MTTQAENTGWLLATTLQVAVPLRLAELKHMPPGVRADRITRWAAEGATAIAHAGDTLMFRTRSRDTKATAHTEAIHHPGTAETFNAAAKGIAAAATAPGGITVFGVTFCARHHPGGTAAPAGTIHCPTCATDPERPPVAAARVVQNLDVL